MKQGVDGGFREEIGDNLEHLLATAHPGQPVMNQSNARLWSVSVAIHLVVLASIRAVSEFRGAFRALM